MANITFDGFSYLNDGTLSTGEIKYQGFFYPNGTASPDATWNMVRVVEGSGYYNINLGDADWCGPASVILPDSIVVIVFWVGDTFDRNSLCIGASRLLEWSCMEVMHDGSDFYTNQVQVKENIIPIADFTIDASGYVGDSYTVTNTSYDAHSWVFMGTTLQHVKTKYGEDIQLINNITTSRYNWGDGDTDTLVGVANGSHTWSTAGNYTITLEVEDECTDLGTDDFIIEIKNKAPIPDINCIEISGTTIANPNTVITFEYSGTDANDQITSIDWTIEDSGSYGSTNTTSSAARDDVVPHTAGQGTSWCGEVANSGAFTNPGVHTVSIVVHWNDGFEDKIINYSKDFTQGLFSGPTVDFYQEPAQATTSGTVTLINDSINYDRVGKSLPDCNKYDWTFTDGSNIEEVNDVALDYEFNITPLSVSAEVKLCANWHDGWESHQACKTKDIVFETKVIVTPESCYYNLDIIGTSSDGSISGYSWEVYSDTTISGGTGPWELVWESPEGVDQKIKQLGFTEVGYYKVVGFIHGGGTTSDEELVLVAEVCPPGSITDVIWDGTGELDNGEDWDRSGFGVESEEASHAGTHGLNAYGMQSSDYILFENNLSAVDISEFESLTFWINLHNIANNAELNTKLNMTGGAQGSVLKLSNYINISKVDEWQKVYVPLADFGVKPSNRPGHPTYVNTLRLNATGDVSFYLDDVIFTAGVLERVAVSICSVDITSDEVGVTSVTGNEMKPSMKGKARDPYNSRISAVPFPKPKIR